MQTLEGGDSGNVVETPKKDPLMSLRRRRVYSVSSPKREDQSPVGDDKEIEV
jgi:hypothetical protein